MKNQEYLRHSPFFWSRLGFCYDPPRADENGNQIVFSRNYEKYRKFHKQFEDAEIKYHTTILHSGWVGVDKYDYRLTDETLSALLDSNPNMLYMPRVKLNVPPDWCRANPADTFVYENGKDLTKQEIASLVGSSEHDWFGFNCAHGYAVNGGDGSFVDTRPNVGGTIGLQSFSSPKWLADASEALARLIEHIQNSPYADQIIGYHIAYGQCGETCLWGGWRARDDRRGDFGKTNTRMFVNFGLEKYGSEQKLLEKWGFDSMNDIEVPSVWQRDSVKSSLRELFYDDAHNVICRDYNEFSSRANAVACETFCRVVKEKTDGNAAAGIFYGYIYMPQSAYMSHCDIDYVLSSPYIDFVASPKAYFRTLAGEPGGEQGPTYSINKKKVWLDEIDNWTHLDKREGRAENLFETLTLVTREGVKNLSTDQGFWWMDLGEGWYDMPEIMSLIKELSEVQKQINAKAPHRSTAEILIVVDENSIKSMSASYGLTGGLLYNLQSEVRLCGAPADTLRLSDLYTADISGYKMIVFANAFCIDAKLRKILADNAEGKTYIWNYAAGILSPDFSLENTRDITGFSIKEFEYDYKPEEFGYKIAQYKFGPVQKLEKDFPLIEIADDGNSEIISRYPNGKIMCAKMQHNGGTSVLCAFPSMMSGEFRSFAAESGCRLIAPEECTVYADNRIVGVFPKNDVSFKLDFGGKTVNGKKSVQLDIPAKGARYFVYD